MDVYVAVVSHHGKPEEVHLFMAEAEARRFATELSQKENWEDKSKEVDHHDDHDHESHWLEDWGDEDGCGVVAGLSEPAAS